METWGWNRAILSLTIPMATTMRMIGLPSWSSRKLFPSLSKVMKLSLLLLVWTVQVSWPQHRQILVWTTLFDSDCRARAARRKFNVVLGVYWKQYEYEYEYYVLYCSSFSTSFRLCRRSMSDGRWMWWTADSFIHSWWWWFIRFTMDRIRFEDAGEALTLWAKFWNIGGIFCGKVFKRN